jgi:MazG family protein
VRAAREPAPTGAAAGPPSGRSRDLAEGLLRLDAITRRLRRDCPWDREQDERSIVPHTVEEAYELADAAHHGDEAALLDELGDVLFQVYFLALLLDERGAGSLLEVADGCREKLVRRHPHVFGDAEARTAGEVLRSWGRIKREDERGGELFGRLPETLPATLHALKLRRRAASAGVEREPPGVEDAARRLRAAADRDERFAAAGLLLMTAVAAAGEAGVDPELALREAAEGYRREIEAAEGNRREVDAPEEER